MNAQAEARGSVVAQRYLLAATLLIPLSDLPSFAPLYLNRSRFRQRNRMLRDRFLQIVVTNVLAAHATRAFSLLMMPIDSV